MKNLNKITVAAFAMMLMFGTVSCNKEKNPIDALVKLNASINQPNNGNGSKTDVNAEGSVTWSEGDQINVYDKNGQPNIMNLLTGAGTKTATFGCDSELGESPYTFAYGNMGRNDNGTFTFSIPASQKNIAEQEFQAGPMVAYAVKDQNVSFNNAMSWLNIGLQSTEGVSFTKIELKDLNTGAMLNGTLTVGVSADNQITTNAMSEGTNTISIEDNMTLTAGADAKFFTFLVPAGAFTGTEKFQITVYNGVQKLLDVKKTFTLNSVNGIEASKIYYVTISDKVDVPEPKPYIVIDDVKWALCNVGAEIRKNGTINGEIIGYQEWVYGDYYMWGEHNRNQGFPYTIYTTKPADNAGDTDQGWTFKSGYESAFRWDNTPYQTVKGLSTAAIDDYHTEYTKYVTSAYILDPGGSMHTYWSLVYPGEPYPTYGNPMGSPYYDNKSQLELTDDIARLVWGADWRMPTQAEFNKLINGANFVWTNNYNNTGVKGYVITSKTDATQKMFLPAAGTISRQGENYKIRTESGVGTYYWSSTLASPYCQSGQNLTNRGLNAQGQIVTKNPFTGTYGRLVGMPIRPVYVGDK